MTKILLMLAILFSSFLTVQVAIADPSHASHKQNKRDRYEQSDREASSDNEDIKERRREREERGVRRLQQHKWQAGYTMPQHYRSDGYKVDYRELKLPKPGRNQQWYKVNNDYILVETENNNIIQIMGL